MEYPFWKRRLAWLDGVIGRYLILILKNFSQRD